MRTLCSLAILAGLAACAEPKPPVLSVGELSEDPVLLQSVLDRCNANAHRASTDPECANARIVIARKGAEQDAKRAAREQAEFERLRAAKRAADDRRQQEAESQAKPFDPYSTPVNPDAAPKR